MLSSILLATPLALLSPVIEPPAVDQVHPKFIRTQQILLSKQLIRQRFSVSYPDHWLLIDDNQNNDGSWVIYNFQPPGRGSGYMPPFFIRTNLGFENFSIQEIFRQQQQAKKRFGSNYEYASTEYKRENLNIANKPALRVWEKRNIEPSNRTVTTYIPLGDRSTFVAISFYTTVNREAEKTVLSVHDSIRLR
ncbi:hypothetical protein [Synechococcus elongatus]|uniref:hypothetical protein n=1 Tax=Synechococcus elongatus TaxID=32046 RepID=UPI0030D4991B